jgi:membrane protein YdbS with pleckstrin-like domain
MEKAYKNLGFFLILFIPLVFLGFYKTYFIHFPSFEENIDGLVHLHAIIASIWIIMLIIQPLLIRYKKFEWHKTLGKISYLVFPLLILSFIPRMIAIINSNHPNILFFPIADCTLLILFYSLAIYNRRKTPKHMRYMIGAAIVFLGPTIGRIGPLLLGLPDIVTQNTQYGIIYLILIGLVLLDRKHGKKIQPYMVVFAGWILHMVIFNMIF